MRKWTIFSLLFILLNSCTSANKTPALVDTPNKKTTPTLNTAQSFEQRMYYKIDKVYSGPVFESESKGNLFYRIIEIPEEENISLYAEEISIGEEEGKYQLVRRVKLSNDNVGQLQFGFAKVDSLKFIDSLTVSVYSNNKRQIIDFADLK